MDQASEVRSLDDIKAIERIPLADRMPADNSYDALRLSAERNPDAIAISFFLAQDYQQTMDISYEALFGRVTQAANLFYELGVGSHDVVSLLLPNLIDTHVAMWGAEAAGIVNPVNPLLEADIIVGILKAAQSRVLVVLGNAFPNDIWPKAKVIMQAMPDLKIIVVYGNGEEGGGVIDFEQALERQNATKLDSARQIMGSDVASMFHTGGTTGIPKLTCRSHFNEIANCIMISIIAPLKEGDTVLVGLPLFHVNAAIGTGLMPLMLGIKIILAGVQGFRTPGVVENLYAIIDHFKVNFFSAVPTLYAGLLQLPAPQKALTSMKFAISGAAPLPVDVFHRFEARTGIKLVEGWGMTETTVASSMTPIVDNPRVGSVGLRFPYCEMKTVQLDQNNHYSRDSDTDEIGILVTRGANVCLGYKETEHDSKLWVICGEGEKWLNTGDLARQDADGYFWLTGRAKELIIRGGHNIDPKLIEDSLQQHPAVALVAAVGRPDSYAGEVPVAYVVLNHDGDANVGQLMTFASENIQERAAVPKSIELIDELPMTAVGKIFKPQLVWWQTEDAIRAAIGALGLALASIAVEVGKHERYGAIAQVRLVLEDASDQVAVNEQVSTILGEFSVKSSLLIEAG